MKLKKKLLAIVIYYKISSTTQFISKQLYQNSYTGCVEICNTTEKRVIL